MAMQLSSQSFPMEMRESVVRSLKTWADCAMGEILVEIFKVARRFGLMTLPFATLTVRTDVVHTVWEQCGRESR